MRYIMMLVGVVCCALPGLAKAQGALALETFGVICEVRSVGTQDAPGTVTGILNVIDHDQVIDVVTALVPAEIGLSFGIRARLSQDALPMDLEVVVTHPPMGPEGQEVERWDTSLLPGQATLNLFSFEEAFELVEGPWTFRLMQGDAVLVEQPFTVTPRGTVPAVQRACLGSMVIS